MNKFIKLLNIEVFYLNNNETVIKDYKLTVCDF